MGKLAPQDPVSPTGCSLPQINLGNMFETGERLRRTIQRPCDSTALQLHREMHSLWHV
jgi:hypothetical protein